jgi:hypothetical protein
MGLGDTYVARWFGDASEAPPPTVRPSLDAKSDNDPNSLFVVVFTLLRGGNACSWLRIPLCRVRRDANRLDRTAGVSEWVGGVGRLPERVVGERDGRERRSRYGAEWVFIVVSGEVTDEISFVVGRDRCRPSLALSSPSSSPSSTPIYQQKSVPPTWSINNKQQEMPRHRPWNVVGGG